MQVLPWAVGGMWGVAGQAVSQWGRTAVQTAAAAAGGSDVMLQKNYKTW